MSDAIFTKLTIDGLRDTLQQIGYRAESLTDPIANVTYLRSSTGGIGFDVRPGNSAADQSGAFSDVALLAILQVQGDLPLEIVNRWNVGRRFARLQFSKPYLVLNMDILVAGGTTLSNLRAQIEVWDRLLQDLIAYLREELRTLNVNQQAAPVSATSEQSSQGPQEIQAAKTAAPAAKASTATTSSSLQ
ncbi:MAG TPA: YbjN domain-containing protein [Bradyrhizobium sp.]|nr:YbjN domain-containing protein [Bradyrhizobium sp.]